MSFYITIFWMLVTVHMVISDMNQTWSLAPRAPMVWLFVLTTMIVGLFGFNDRSSLVAKVRSWVSTVLSNLLLLVLSLGVLRYNAMHTELIKTVHSPDKQYTINFYLTNGGAMTSLGVLGELDGPLWFYKKVFYDYRMDRAEVEWINNHTVSINGHLLDLGKGETFRD
ncbi:hypothetical protein GCM10008967_30300 [Bacillus carboniphilus]|uniref:Uncharacterized protein n=2 Tax=Bacillus carboniphilus TaxID=86663 RepID=A0ABN0WHF7_9BACI